MVDRLQRTCSLRFFCTSLGGQETECRIQSEAKGPCGAEKVGLVEVLKGDSMPISCP